MPAETHAAAPARADNAQRSHSTGPKSSGDNPGDADVGCLSLAPLPLPNCTRGGIESAHDAVINITASWADELTAGLSEL